jgi:hypothetical protein
MRRQYTRVPADARTSGWRSKTPRAVLVPEVVLQRANAVVACSIEQLMTAH